ncbi:uncharacterized protein An02g12700 [Aspergillus niger]|uniref:Contig An02c0410, genomic contig n=2 Tax=Aspergillus niger TaxID=5061 RepID=A2QEZ0_ASPNC|nr:uncharacterized protein An02g12700 [Aspergillus niger]CAK44540.1 unnamed protein product [Aspergillus niger]
MGSFRSSATPDFPSNVQRHVLHSIPSSLILAGSGFPWNDLTKIKRIDVCVLGPHLPVRRKDSFLALVVRTVLTQTADISSPYLDLADTLVTGIYDDLSKSLMESLAFLGYQTPRAPRITGNNILLSTVYLIISRKEDELSPWHITMGVLGACGDAWHASMGFVVTACRRLKGLIPCCSCRIDGPVVVIGISL